jgi:hypothetical protein
VSASKSSLAALTLGAIGVVYGDIGTSVLYAVKEVFGSGHVPFTPENVYGILSIFFWTLTVIVSVKYVVLVLRADNNGEGGLVAMLALASQAVKHKPELRRICWALAIFGTSLFYGDGVITPAISVLSAVEGLEIVSPRFKGYVIPMTLLMLFALFFVQKRGTGGIGKFFRADHPAVVCRDCGAGCHPYRAASGNSVLRSVRTTHVGFMWIPTPASPSSSWGRGFVRDGSRGAVCRFGAFWQEAHSPGLVCRGDAISHAQLFWSGRIAAEEPGSRQKSVLPDGPGLGTDPRWCYWPRWRRSSHLRH